MVMNSKQIQNNADNNHPSQLAQFSLAFEYDKTLQQLMREVRVRTLDGRKA